MSGLALSIGFTIAWMPIFVFRAESIGDALPVYRRGERFWVVATPFVVSVHVALSCIALGLTPAVGTAWAVACLAICAAGVAFYLWARRAIGPMRRTRLPDEPPLTLRSDGPFGLVRNPMYLAMLIAAAAPAMAARRPLLALTFAACFATLAIRAVQEEQRLHEQIGPAYAAYCRRVRRLVPFVW